MAMQRIQWRIIGGEFKGRKFSVNIGDETRPTSDRVRESVFNVLSHQLLLLNKSLANCRVFDAFAGTGSYGFEALSRGSTQALFIDQSHTSLNLIQQTATSLRVNDRMFLKRVDMLNIDYSLQPYNIVFIDPPYNYELSNKLLFVLVEKNYIADKTIIIFETKSNNIVETTTKFIVLKTLKFAHCQVILLRYEEYS